MRVISAITLHRLRAGWRRWAVLALLVGVAGGAVMATAAGARRTDSAFPRFLRSTAAADVLIGPAGSGITGFDLALGNLAGVVDIAPVVGLNCLPVTRTGNLDEASEVAAPLDGRLGHRLERPRILAGRQPRPDWADEVMIDQIAAQQLGLHVGSTLRLAAVSDRDPSRIRFLTERVVGIEVISSSIVPVNILAQTAYIQASPALFHKLGTDYAAFDGAYVKLSAGTSVAAFSHEATQLANTQRYKKPTSGQVFVSDESVQDATVERTIRPQAVALAIFALVLAVTVLLVTGQAAARLLLASSVDNPVLAAMGVTRWQLLAAALFQIAIAAAVGAALACAVAIAASPMTPIGAARLAELRPGVAVDWVVLAPGFAGIVALLIAMVARTAWRESSGWVRGSANPTAPGSGSRMARWLAARGAPVTAVTGVRMALEPSRGRGGVPVRSAVVGTAISVAAVMASVTFWANLTHLERTPRLYGQTWEAAVELQFGTITPSRFVGIVKSVPGVTGWTYGLHGTVTLEPRGAVVPAIGLAPGRGPLLSPTMLAGHPPAAGELVLGATTLSQGRLRLGQHVVIAAAGQRSMVRIVGRAVFPYFGQGSFTPTDLGQGAIVPASMLAAEVGAEEREKPGVTSYNFVLLAFAPGPRQGADIAAFRRAMGPFCASVQQSTCVLTSQRPNGVTKYAQIDATPLALAGLLALLGLGVLAQFTFESARFRRRDFAVLRTLGLQRRQLTAVTCWQITTLTGLALLLALPIGAAAGHWAWSLFADVLGISPGTAIALAPALVLTPAVLLAANLVALWPGRRSSTVRPSELLRTE
jgi:hypothetical protein